MKKIIPKFSICLILALTFLFCDLINPAYAFAHGFIFFLYVGKAIAISFVIMVVVWACLRFIKPEASPLLKIIPILVFIVSFFTSYFIFVAIDEHYWNTEGGFISDAHHGTTEELQRYLNQGINPDVKNRQGDTALGRASWGGNVENVRLLLNRGANINIKNKEGETPLILSAISGHIEVTQLLLEKGANIEDRDNDGTTALMRAVIHEHPEVAKILLDAGADFKARDNSGETVLMITAKGTGFTEFLSLLLKNGANINAQDNKGRTALMKAIQWSKPENAVLLIKQGADINIKDENGCTAKDYAKRSRKKELIDIFSIARNEKL